jgi:3-phosphoshikimate 1-carboxyvinyltransferase
MPGDKSISHRALLFNGLATGRARIRNLLQASDIQSTAACLTQLGVSLELQGEALIVTGTGGRFIEPSAPLDCGNSGTGLRLLTGAVAAQDILVVLTGDESLRQRPMGRITVPLQEMGVKLEGRDGGRLPPLVVRGGGLQAIRWTNPVASAQVKTCLMLATLGAQGTLRYREPHLSRDHSERMLAAMGITMTRRDGWLDLPGGQVPRAIDIDVPGDISSAAFFLVAASIVPGSDLVLEGVGVNATRTGVLDALLAMGADITRSAERTVSGEPVADLRVRHASLCGTHWSGELVPRAIDEFPVLAVAAACAKGETLLSNAAELRVKECDRITATVAGLRILGIDADERADGFVIQGGSLAAGRIDAQGDHRIAMAFAVAACGASGLCRIDDAENISTSFPEFPALLARARGQT